MRAAGALAALALVAALAGCSTERSTTAPPPPGGPALRIAWASNRPPSEVGGADIYFYDIGTGRGAYLPPNVNTASTEGPCAFSGDGHWMAFNSSRQLTGVTGSLFLYEVSTGNTTVPPGPNAFANPVNPSLSHDGRYLAFQTQVGGAFDQDIVLWDLQTDQRVPTPSLHEVGAADFDPALSADGGLIAFTTNRSTSVGGWDVALYDVAGDSLVALPGLDSSANDLGVTISGDGRYLAFQSNRPGGEGVYDVYVYDRRTSQLLPLPGANSALSELTPGISEDGRYVAYETENRGGGDVLLYDVQAGRLVPLPGLDDPYFLDRYPAVVAR